MKKFNERHIFTLSGDLIQGRRSASHEMLLFDNRKAIPVGKGFVHGNVWRSPHSNNPEVHHYLNYAINDNIGISDMNYTHMGQKAKPEHYEPALRTLLQHYSENPERKFKISLGIGDEEDPSHPVLKQYKRATGREAPSPFDGFVDLTSIDDIKNFLNKSKAEIKRKRLSRDLPAVDTSRLGIEPPMAQGNMSTAEWNFWRRKGLGDSYMPIMTFKELINESRLEQLSVQNIGRRSWIGPHGESIDIDRHAREGDTDYHHLHLVVDKPHLFGFTTDELQTIDPFRHRLLKSKTTWGGRAHTWSNAIISEVGKRGWIRAANDTFKDQNSDDIIHHFNLSHHGYEGEHNLKAFIPALKTVRDTISSTQNSKRDPIHVYLEGYDSNTIRRFDVTLRSIESINSFIKNHADLPKQETKSTHLPIILQQFNSTQTREMLGRNPPEGIPQAIWNNMKTIGDSYMPIMSFKTFLSESNAEAFRKKFDTIVNSPEFKKLSVRQWNLTGHNPDVGIKGTSPEIEAMKEKIFGKRQGNSHLWWYHQDHGLVTHPAIGDLTHKDIESANEWNLQRNNADSSVVKKITLEKPKGIIDSIRTYFGNVSKVPEWVTEKNKILARGRIESHEDGGGLISYDPGTQHTTGLDPGTRMPVNPNVIRTLGKQFPKHQIHDGLGNLIESKKHNKILSETVRKTGDDYTIYSEKGKKLGKYENKEAAVKRLKQIEWFKRHRNY